MKKLGYVSLSDAENAAKEIASAQCRNIQKYALKDFGTPIDQDAEQKSRDWAGEAFLILIDGSESLPALVTPSDEMA